MTFAQLLPITKERLEYCKIMHRKTVKVVEGTLRDCEELKERIKDER